MDIVIRTMRKRKSLGGRNGKYSWKGLLTIIKG